MTFAKYADALEDYIALHGNSGASVLEIVQQFRDSDNFRHSQNQFLGSLYYLIQNRRVFIGLQGEKVQLECEPSSRDIQEFFTQLEAMLYDGFLENVQKFQLYPSTRAIDRALGALDSLRQLGPLYLTVLEEISKTKDAGITITQLRTICNTQLHQMHYATNSLLER